MKMFVISDNNDTFTGMKLCGVNGVVVHTEEEVVAAGEPPPGGKNFSIIMIYEKEPPRADSYISQKMNSLGEPLFLEIPDRHGSTRNSSMSSFISTSIGLKVD